MLIYTSSLKFFLSFILLSAVILVSCSDDEIPDPIIEECETTGLTYTADIKSLIDSNCATAGCHTADNTAIGSLASHQSIVDFMWQDRIVGSINHDSGFSQMPKGGSKLADCDIDQIDAWIAAGLPE